MTVDPVVADETPAAKLVYAALDEHGASTTNQVATYTTLQPRTVRRALDRLVDAGVVGERPGLEDAGAPIYVIEGDA